MKTFGIISAAMIGMAAMSTVWAGGPAGGGFELTRTTLDAGGHMRAAGFDFELSGTVGQHDAGGMTGDGFTLTGGFWFGVPLGDCEDDGDVDLYDHAGFEVCLTGPGGTVTADCRCYDIDRNGTVDLGDVAQSQVAHTGS